MCAGKMSTPALDPAHQLSAISQQLNVLETELDGKSGRLERQYKTIQGLEEEILGYKAAHQQQLLRLTDKTQQLRTLQDRVASLRKNCGNFQSAGACVKV